jgi:hypothetical protein
MSARPTKELSIGCHTLVLNEWITLKEYRQIMAVYIQSIKVQADKNTDALSSADAMTEGQDLAISFIVVSLDGSSEDILGRIQALPNDEAQELLVAVENISSPKKK